MLQGQITRCNSVCLLNKSSIDVPVDVHYGVEYYACIRPTAAIRIYTVFA